MPRNRNSARGGFDINTLDSQQLDTSDGPSIALRAIEAACFRGGQELTEMITALNGRSYILEYIISVLGNGAFEKLSKSIITGFPTSAISNITDTMSMRLLQRFSSSLQPASDASHDLVVFCKKVELSFSILNLLEENFGSSLAGGKVSTVSRRKGKAAVKNRRIDPLPFDFMKVSVPTTNVEARDVYAEVLSQLQGILEHYLLLLREPRVSEIFKSLYIKANPSPQERADQPQNSAFPTAQPMQEAIYFDSIEGFGEWPILLSARARKNLRGIKDGAIFEIVMKKIKQLSQGHFSRDNQKSLTGPKMRLPIYEARMTGDTRIVYQIDCIPDLRCASTGDSQPESQVIRMFGIFTHAQLHHGGFWDSLSQQLQQRGPDYIDRCTFRNKPGDDNVVLPAFFPPLPSQVQDIPQVEPLVKIREEDMKDIHSMLVLEKFVVLSQALLNSILADKEVSYVFSVSAQEQEVIEHPSSCYVIGRSGTGKTTTLLFKMLAIQRTWEQYPDMGPRPRQVFITQSPVLAAKADEYYKRLMSSYSFEEFCAKEKGVDQETELIDQDDNKQWRSDLPERFSELLDDHFPLFVTYDRLCTMLQNDIRRGNRDGSFVAPTNHPGDEETSPTSPTPPLKSRMQAGSGIASSSDYAQQSRRNFVSYGVFLASYWDHLPQTLTRSLDPALVFREFMGVIKGSEDTVGTKNRCLDRESYKLLSARSQATFSHKRDDIYDLFTAYTKLSRGRDYDAADRTHYILRELRRVGLAGRKVDFLYVDEIQDNLLIDTLVLRTICANRHGLFWAGDTAQTISIASSFRFADLKAYQYRIEEQLSNELGVAPVEPRTFELIVNYRSHGGIVRCARSIIELITCYWPYSIDALQPEQAFTDGPPPIFFTDQEEDDLESFLGSGPGEASDFGAHQCILVRNDITKARLERRFRGSIIMTLYESKGLEFDDVLLYNFFEDSTATLNQWRLLLNEVSNVGNPSDVSTFDETRYAGICVELKFLYVAITRARNRLWIVDSSGTAGPMKVYWSRKNLIEIRSSVSETQNLMVTTDTAEEWSEAGKRMFLSKRYAQASVAFFRAGWTREVAICDAYLLRERAWLISTTASMARARAFINAANAFIACAKDTPPQRSNERLAYYGTAGECYSEAQDLKNAGDNYRKGEQYLAAAYAYQAGEHFDEVVEIITQHSSALKRGTIENLTTAAAEHYFEHLEIKAALNLFHPEKDALEFLKNRRNLDEAHIRLLTRWGRILEAAEICAENGDMLRAVELLTASGVHNEYHVRPTIEYLLAGLRQYLTVGMSPKILIVSKLLSLTGRLDRGAMTQQEVHELTMFEAIQRADSAGLRELAQVYIRSGDAPAALLCLDHVFSFPLELRNLSLSEVRESLSLYHDYIRLLNKLRRDESLAKGSDRQKLFGFQVQGRNLYLVPEHSGLHQKLTGKSGLNRKGTEEPHSHEELTQLINRFVLSRIHDRTEMQNDACYDVYGFSPCLRFLIYKKCNPPGGKGGKESCAFQHIQQDQLTIDWYQARLRLILLQIRILESARYCDRDVKDYWLGILYSALHPPFWRLGSLANFDVVSISEGDDGLRVVREWARDACNYINYKPSEPVDRQRFMVACSLAFDLDRDNALETVPSAEMYRLASGPDKKLTSLDSRHTARTSTCGEANSLVQNFVKFLIAEPRDILTAGQLCIHEILKSPLRIDLNIVCNVSEKLSGLFIMAYKVGSQKGVLHGVTLPRSWIVNLAVLDTPLRVEPPAFLAFASNMIKLLKRVDEQIQQYAASAPRAGEQFVVNGGRLKGFMGSLYIARICFCLSLVGYNLDNIDLKARILASIQSLRKEDGQSVSWIYRRYVDAKNWEDLAHALAEPLKNSPFDEMILLLHRNGPSGPPPRHVRAVSYDTLEEVPNLLSMTSSTPMTGGTPPHHTRPHVAVVAGAESKSDDHRQEQEENVEKTQKRVVGEMGAGTNMPGEGLEEGIISPETATVNVPHGSGGEASTSGGDQIDHERGITEKVFNAVKLIQDAYRCHLKRRGKAARKIQVAYRRHLTQKHIAGKVTDEIQVHYWHLLRQRSMKMEWPKGSQYYLLFRVPLAYILICLDTIRSFLDSEKEDAKKHILTADEADFEKSVETFNHRSNLLKQTIALHEKLSPSAELHDRQSVSELQHAVLEVKVIVESLDSIPGSIGTRNQVENHWNRGRKWIFEK